MGTDGARVSGIKGRAAAAARATNGTVGASTAAAAAAGETDESGLDFGGNGSGRGGLGVGSGNPDGGTKGERGRGRPKKEKDAAAQISVESQETLEIKPKRSHKKKQQAIPVDGASAAAGLLEMVQIFTTARFGAAGNFTEMERFCIEPALGRLIEKYGSAAEKYAGLIDPIMVGAGVFLYASRLATESRARAVQETSTPENYTSSAPLGSEPSTPPPPDSGGNPVPSAADYIFDMVGGALT